MQNKLINIPDVNPIDKNLTKREKSYLKFQRSISTGNFTSLTPTDLLFYFEYMHNQAMPFPRYLPNGTGLGYLVGQFKTGLLQPYELSGIKAIDAINKFIDNYPHVCDPIYKNSINPYVFTMPDLVDRVMNYVNPFETKIQPYSDEVF